jgi:hypothetical protein
MNDEQFNLLINSINKLTTAVQQVAENIDNISPYSDYDLRKEVHLIAEVIEDGVMKL